MTPNSQVLDQIRKTWLWDLFLLAGLLAIFYFAGLGSYPLFTPDEGRYSEVAREMIATSDYVTPRLNGVVFLDKPILYYWLQVVALQLFGLHEWALRFWPALMGIFGCLTLYVGGRLLFNRRTGLLASLILATNGLYFGAAHYANLDLELAVLVSTTLLFFLLGIKTQKSAWIYAAYVFAGLAVLTKGLIGIAFPALILGAWIVLLNKWRLIPTLKPFQGLAIILAIVLPWYIMAQNANPEFFHFFFVVQQFSRFLSTNDFNNKVPTWFYLPIVLAGFLPWTFFLFGTFNQNLKALWQNRARLETTLYFMLWAVLIFAFFSIPHSKTIGYILPIFPALAMLTAHYLDQNWDRFLAPGRAWQMGILVLSFAGFAAACLVAPRVRNIGVTPELLPYLKGAGLNFTVATLVLGFFFSKKSFTGMWAAVSVSAVVFFFILVGAAGYMNENSTKPLALQLNSRLLPDDEVVTFYKYFQDLPLYTGKRITIVADWEDPGIAHNDNWLRELWYGKSFQDTQAWLINEETFWKRWNAKKRVYVLTNLKYLDDFKAKAKTRLHMVGQYNETVLMSNIPII